MTTLAFAVRRKEPVLVGPAAATPRETKHLSDIDAQVFLRRHVPTVAFYRGGGGFDADGDDQDPVSVIRRALGKALVPYYPLAGRLRELEGDELVVDCTGEGVLFVEANADVRLAELEVAGLRPPLPYMDKLLPDFEGSSGVLDRPFLLVQVTRLLCGGFVLAFRISHILCDGAGVGQFMNAVGELARGLPSPTVSPAWSRELLRSRPPVQQRIITQREHDTMILQHRQVAAPPGDGTGKVMRTFTFGPAAIAAIKACLPPHLRETATTFEALTAALWRARTAALELPPEEEASLLFYYNVRAVRELGLPAGYYGNAVIILAVLATSGELLPRSVGDAVGRIRDAKAAVTAEFVRSATTTDPRVLRRWSDWSTPNAFRVSDVRNNMLRRVDMGWGEPVYCGRADPLYEVSFLYAVKNGAGQENAVAVSIVLPRVAMDRFASKIQTLLAPPPITPPVSPGPQARL